MWIVCYTDDSQEISIFIFSEKKKFFSMSYAWILLGGTVQQVLDNRLK